MTDRLLPFDAPLERLKALHPKLIDLNLDRMLRVCEAPGRPQDKFPPVVHVAGTNGKGSPLAPFTAMARSRTSSRPQICRTAQ
jgi:dihydrofolate synthase/folylpolyglutamate synthase